MRRIALFIVCITLVFACLALYGCDGALNNGFKESDSEVNLINEESDGNVSSADIESGEQGNDESDIETEYFTVSFDVNGGIPIEDIKVEKGAKIPKTTAYHTDKYYLFKQWEINGKKVDFDAYIVESDITLKAVWATFSPWY